MLTRILRSLLDEHHTPEKKKVPSRPTLNLEPLEVRCTPATLRYSSYLGGNTSDEVTCVAVDGAGNIYLAGRNDSDSFPGDTSGLLLGRGFIAKMNPSGSALLWSKRLDLGSGYPLGIAVDGSGNAYITGYTSKTTGLATAGAAQTSYGGLGDAFVMKFTTNGTLSYATYLGGSFLDEGRGIAVDQAGNAIVTGYTQSQNFPTKNALQGIFHPNAGSDAFVTKLNTSGTQIHFSTYLGGNANNPNETGATATIGNAITVDAAGRIYVTGSTMAADLPVVNPLQAHKGFGQDAFVTQFASDGSSILYSTYLGDPRTNVSLGSSKDIGYGIAVDPAGTIFVTGVTASNRFPTKNAFRTRLNGNRLSALDDPFVTRINPQKTGLTQLVYSTYLGGGAVDYGQAIAVDRGGNAYITGHTNSDTLHGHFPLVNPFERRFFAGAFLAKLAPTGKVLFNSYYGRGGETGNGVAVDGFGNVIFVGQSNSARLNTTSNAFQRTFPGATDSGFVAMLAGNNRRYVGRDQDGDLFVIQIAGPGVFSVVRDDPDGDNKGPIKAIYLRGSNAVSSVLSIAVTPAAGGDGVVQLGSLSGSALLRFVAPRTDLTGAGINLTGKLGALVIRDVVNGADILATGAATQYSAIQARTIGAGTTIQVGSGLASLRAATIGTATILAPRLNTLVVSGDFSALMTLTGTGFVLGNVSIQGAVRGATMNLLAGSVNLFRAGAFLDSTLYLGENNSLSINQRIATFSINGLGNPQGKAFETSTVSAYHLGNITLASVKTNNAGTKFGFRAQGVISSVQVHDPSFTYHPEGAPTQGIGDFEVKKI